MRVPGVTWKGISSAVSAEPDTTFYLTNICYRERKQQIKFCLLDTQLSNVFTIMEIPDDKWVYAITKILRRGLLKLVM
jgi:hypothetical protein